MSIADIKDVIVKLSDADRKELASWLDELEDDEWDRQMEQDFTAGGRGDRLIAEARAEIAAGLTRPLEEVLTEAENYRM